MKFKRFGSLLPLTALLFGCASAGTSQDLMADIAPATVESETISPEDAAALADFSLSLLRDHTPSAENTLLSPLSLAAALGMTANGAAGETRAQMERTLGLPADRLNALMAALLHEENDTLHLANGIWFRDHDLTVKPTFLQTNADYYGAAARQAAMDDATCREINRFVQKETAGMIKDMLAPGTLSDDTVMCLVNALAFEAKWATVYTKNQVHTGDFTREDGKVVSAEFMYSAESHYLSDEGASGFIKPYRGLRYAFAALLPDEGIALEDYLGSLSGERLISILSGAERCTVNAALPKFSYACTYSLTESLKQMGMPDAFDADTADFSAMADSPRGKIFIDFVLHKTFIEVAEQGTRAGAATVVATNDGIATRDPKTVHLTRPFLYMIVDTERNLPVFIGTVVDPS